MDTYKRKINLRHFAPQSGTSKDIAVSGNFSFLPNSDGKVKWETYSHYKGWLERFIVDSAVYEVRKRDNEVILVDARKYCSEYVNAENFTEQLSVLKGWLCDSCGVYEDVHAARVGVSLDCCGKKVFVSADADDFIGMFGGKDNACRLLSSDLTGSVKQSVDIPILISSDVQDLGMYEVFTGDTEPDYVCRNIVQSGYVESKLDTLLRARKTYDDNGNILPYCFNPEERRNELPYALNIPCDVTYSNGCFLCNILKEIHYYRDNGAENTAARDAVYYDGTMDTAGTIEFVYRVGVIYDESGDERNDESGIEYKEKRRYELSNDGENALIISDSTVDNPEEYDPAKQYARYYINDEACEYVYSDGFMFKNDAFMNVQDSLIMKDNVYIDRGTSAAYEAFNVLGETNTIEDIENYRDDWFRIRGKND